MIKDLLIPEVERRFGHLNPSINTEENPIVRIQPIQDAIGDLVICDDGDEATVYIEKITHSHFGNFDYDLSEEEKEKEIAESVIEFMDDLFADRVLLHTSPNNRIGGWKLIEDDQESLAMKADHVYYLWSKPYEPKM